MVAKVSSLSIAKAPTTRRGNSAAKRTARPARTGAAEDVGRQAIRLSFLIHDVSRMRRTAFDQLMKPLGVTRAQWWVLAHLSRNDGMMQTKLADALDVGKASLGTFIERLEAGGLVERRDDPVDKRAKRVYMARAGQQLLKQMTLEENRLNELILKDLSPTERESMIRQLTYIKQALLRQISPGTAGEED
ncbi:MAG TPA: MarR family transcriptional regulator [Steroidobacteraceae bacterium]|jgi:DNA-binding MarR family transcriptional regulator